MTDALLVIDDDADVLSAVGAYFERLGAEVHRALTGTMGVETFERTRPDVVILDLNLPDLPGLEVLEQLKGRGAAVILLTGNGDIESAVRAMQLGAENFLTKPVDMAHLAAATARVAEKARLARQNARLRARDLGEVDLQSLGISPAMRELERQMALLAESGSTTVLFTGESGTGKGWAARLIHQMSPRATGPFIEVNCAGLSAAFLESELFGHDKDALADAKDHKEGLFELADGGTIFLDEIGDLTAELQLKLLKVLETKAVRRLGGSRDRVVDVRLIAATNRDLLASVKSSRFREDLFYRLNVMPIHLPPIRDRSREDRLALLTRLLGELRAQLPRCPAECSSEALDRLLVAPWPGNIREMRNVLERAMILARGDSAIGLEHLPADLRRGGAGGGGMAGRHQPQTLAESERLQIERALRHHSGNRTRAAQELGISRATLINKIKVYALDL
jgi:DNA-binding NtrC family response regulator